MSAPESWPGDSPGAPEDHAAPADDDDASVGGYDGVTAVEPDEDDFGLTFDFDDDGADPDATAADEFEAEVARLREVIESSRLVQAALQQYLALVNAG